VISRFYHSVNCQSQWPPGLSRRSSTARLLRSWIRIPLGAWMFVCCECCVLSGSGLCDGLITRPEESYRLWHIVMCDQETSKTRRLKPTTGLWEYNQRVIMPRKQQQPRCKLGLHSSGMLLSIDSYLHIVATRLSENVCHYLPVNTA